VHRLQVFEDRRVTDAGLFAELFEYAPDGRRAVFPKHIENPQLPIAGFDGYFAPLVRFLSHDFILLDDTHDFASVCDRPLKISVDNARQKYGIYCTTKNIVDQDQKRINRISKKFKARKGTAR